MEDILAIIFLFGGMTLIGVSFSPVGRALADRIRYGKSAPELDASSAVLAELDGVRSELIEVQERLDFAERLLAELPRPGLQRGE